MLLILFVFASMRLSCYSMVCLRPRAHIMWFPIVQLAFGLKGETKSHSWILQLKSVSDDISLIPNAMGEVLSFLHRSAIASYFTSDLSLELMWP